MTAHLSSICEQGKNQRIEFWAMFFEQTEGPMEKFRQFGVTIKWPKI